MSLLQDGRRLLTLLAIAALCGCSQTPNPPLSAQSAPAGQVPSDAATGCPFTRCIVAGNEPSYSGQNGSLLFFGQGAHGNARPLGEIAGTKTRIGYIGGIAGDAEGNVYVTNSSQNAVHLFAAQPYGNVPPTRSIYGSKTKLSQPQGIALDAQGTLYVADGATSQITEYAPGAHGNAAPIRELSGAATLLDGPLGIALDASGNLYVVNENSGSLTVYAAGAHGDAAPIRTISGNDTGLTLPASVAVASDGTTYVAIPQSFEVAVFAPGADGNAAPERLVTSYLYGPFGVALDSRGKLYVSNGNLDDAPFISVFARAHGNNQPLQHTIEGRRTRLIFPESILVR